MLQVVTYNTYSNSSSANYNINNTQKRAGAQRVVAEMSCTKEKRKKSVRWRWWNGGSAAAGEHTKCSFANASLWHRCFYVCVKIA